MRGNYSDLDQYGGHAFGPNHKPEQLREFDSFFGDLSQRENLFEIKLAQHKWFYIVHTSLSTFTAIGRAFQHWKNIMFNSSKFIKSTVFDNVNNQLTLKSRQSTDFDV